MFGSIPWQILTIAYNLRFDQVQAAIREQATCQPRRGEAVKIEAQIAALKAELERIRA